MVSPLFPDVQAISGVGAGAHKPLNTAPEFLRPLFFRFFAAVASRHSHTHTLARQDDSHSHWRTTRIGNFYFWRRKRNSSRRHLNIQRTRTRRHAHRRTDAPQCTAISPKCALEVFGKVILNRHIPMNFLFC